MDNLFKSEDYEDDNNKTYEEKISLDELYDRKREVEMNRMNVYRRILNRVHNKIKIVSRKKCETTLFYVIPEFVFGVPRYNVNTCISFIIEKLEENGFQVKYTHPNLLFISWGHYIPSYKREQIKKESGVSVDGFGNIIQKKNNSISISKEKGNLIPNKENKKSNNDRFKDITKYKPTGIYNSDLLQRIKDKTE